MIKEYFGIKSKMLPGSTVYDYSALESLDEFESLANDATLIIGVDVNGKQESILYGTEVLQAIKDTVIPSQRMDVVAFALDTDTDQLEHLCAAVQTTKGFHEYGGR